ncbi:MAG: PrsW family intramembrane metalloprotease [Bacteroidetes bacterium]|nr:PrsW family intramembrane metalloprotease [Bacteroidota bacterium]MCW5894726.1 PrsW family intramembrane metalloprotease [Bacteroidota bacterium]
MDIILLFAAGFAPGVFWLWYFYRKDKYEPEPQRLVLRTAGFGVLAAVPVAIVGSPFNESFFVAAVIVAPIIEELAKFAVVRFTIYNNKEFNEPMDGIVYSAAAALGFASIENVGYIADQYSEGGLASASSTFVVRALFSVPGHVLFSTLWGYALGRAKFQPRELRARTVVLGLLLSMLGHALFNLFLTIGLLYAVIVFLLPYLWKRLNRNVDDLLSGSPFKGLSSHAVAIPESERKARDFFLAGSGELSAAPERSMLPEFVQCTKCAADVSLTLSERRRGAYSCPSCNTFNRPDEPVEMIAGESSTNIQDVEDATIPETDNADLEMEALVLRSNALPRTLDCLSCWGEFELSVAERNRGWFVCPKCRFFNAASMPSVVMQFLEKGLTEPVQYRLKPFAVCPSCKSELQLSKWERENGEFACPECGKRTEVIEIAEITNIQQYLLPPEASCPACRETVVIELSSRNETGFPCSHCKTRIDYVEE